MTGGWRYRLGSALGVAVLTTLAVTFANTAIAQTVITSVPIVGQLSPDPPVGAEGVLETVTALVVVLLAFIPLYKPRPRRSLDTVTLAQKRVVVAMFALAAIGYFDYTYRLPRTTLITVTPILLVTLPAWFVWIRQRPNQDDTRAIIVGDNPAEIERLAADVDSPLIGYLCPTSSLDQLTPQSSTVALADGGVQISGLDRLGGLSRIEDVLVEYDIDTAVLAFEHTDRGEFFGALDACYEHGVKAKTHIDHIDSLLVVSTDSEGPIVDIDLEPWDIQDLMLKRLFDVVFAGGALLMLTPIIVLISVAIKLEGNGPILFSQHRTDRFGETFTIYKFRTLKPKPEGEVGTEFADDRRTPLGDFLRTTHLDEIPQLWSILVGDMSVVGPRPAQTDLEPDFENAASTWKRRWFVKPGLTGLAQIYDATSQEPALKIDYDMDYIQRQSFIFDVKIVLRQLYQVGRDVIGGYLEESDADS